MICFAVRKRQETRKREKNNGILLSYYITIVLSMSAWALSIDTTMEKKKKKYERMKLNVLLGAFFMVIYIWLLSKSDEEIKSKWNK